MYARIPEWKIPFAQQIEDFSKFLMYCMIMILLLIIYSNFIYLILLNQNCVSARWNALPLNEC